MGANLAKYLQCLAPIPPRPLAPFLSLVLPRGGGAHDGGLAHPQPRLQATLRPPGTRSGVGDEDQHAPSDMRD